MIKILIFIGLFFIIYLDPIAIGPLKWSQIWKSIFVLFALFKYILLKSKNLKIVNIYLFLCFNFFITLSFFDNSLEILKYCLKYLFFPSIILVLYYNVNKLQDLNNLIRFSSIFVILSFLPFLFNLLPELGESYDLAILGIEQKEAIVGLFQKPHSAAITLSYASVSVLFLFQSEKIKKIKYVYFVLFLFSIYLIVKTYVRTALLMVIIGSVIILVHNAKVKDKIKIGILFFLAFFLITTNVNKDDLKIFEKRLKGETQYNSGKNSELNYDLLGSGRLTIWKSSINTWINRDNLFDFFFGIGENQLIEGNRKAIGQPVFSHNGFIDMLVVNGIVGLVVFLFFLKEWWQVIKNNKIIKLSTLHNYVRAIFFMYLISFLIQGGPIIYSGVFVGITIVLCTSKILVLNLIKLKYDKGIIV